MNTLRRFYLRIDHGLYGLRHPRPAREAEERKADQRHARELAVWNGPRFREWERRFFAACDANLRALDRISARRGGPPGPNRAAGS